MYLFDFLLLNFNLLKCLEVIMNIFLCLIILSLSSCISFQIFTFSIFSYPQGVHSNFSVQKEAASY